MVPDTILADEVIRRLNELIQTDPAVKSDVGKLIEQRIPCSELTANHPTIQVQNNALGFLGLLNGIVGVIPEGGKLPGWGFIAAVFDDNGELSHFRRSDR